MDSLALLVKLAVLNECCSLCSHLVETQLGELCGRRFFVCVAEAFDDFPRSSLLNFGALASCRLLLLFKLVGANLRLDTNNLTWEKTLSFLGYLASFAVFCRFTWWDQ